MSAGASSLVSTSPSKTKDGSAAKTLQSRERIDVPGLVVVEARRWRLRDFLQGSTTARIAARSVAPVLVLHGPVRRYAEALIALDFRSDLARLLEVTRAVAPSAHCLYVHGFQGPYETRMLLDGASMREIQRYLSDVRREVSVRLAQRIREAGGELVALRVIHGSARQVFLEEEQARRGSDVLFVFERRRSLLRDLVFGSVSRAMIEEGRSDVLVV